MPAVVLWNRCRWPKRAKYSADVQAAVEVDLSGIDEREREIVADGHALTLHLVRRTAAEGGYPTSSSSTEADGCSATTPRTGDWYAIWSSNRKSQRFSSTSTPSPEAKYPQAVDEIYAAVKWVAENDAELDSTVAGWLWSATSAGGNMALAAALLAKKRHAPAVRGAGVAVARDECLLRLKSYALYGGERFLTAPLMKWMFDRYTTDARAREEILLSPVNASREELFGLPPTLIAVAENDILRDEGEAMGPAGWTRRASRRRPCASTASSTIGECSTASRGWLPPAT